MIRFDNAVVLGVDNFAVKCAEKIIEFGIPVVVFDTNTNKSLMLDSYLSTVGIEHGFLLKSEISDHLRDLRSQVLLISAHNPMLIPKDVLEKENLRSINFHHSLLPNHPGRNAEAWAIFEQDQYSGITWHYISPKVDGGNIIAQKIIDLDDSITSLKLLQAQKRAAFQSFCENIERLLSDDLPGFPQKIEGKRKIHFSWEVPNDGLLDIKWPGEKISALLRCMDYGILNVLGKPRLIYNGIEYQWNTYKIIKDQKKKPEDQIEFFKNRIQIHRDQYEFQLINHYEIKKEPLIRE